MLRRASIISLIFGAIFAYGLSQAHYAFGPQDQLWVFGGFAMLVLLFGMIDHEIKRQAKIAKKNQRNNDIIEGEYVVVNTKKGDLGHQFDIKA